MNIRTATAADLDAIYFVEKEAFTKEETATRETLEERLNVYPSHFLLLEEEGEIRGYIGGAVTHYDRIRDELYENIGLHDEKAPYQALFSLVVLPQYQSSGYGKALMQAAIEKAKQEGRQGLILTCRERLISYYESFGYQNHGVSESVHGGITWYDMRLEFKEHQRG